MKKVPSFVERDPWLKPYLPKITVRNNYVYKREKDLTGGKGNLTDFAAGHLYYGVHKEKDGWVFREWAPNATAIYLIGDFSGWKKKGEYAFSKISHDTWELRLAANQLHHKDLYKLFIEWPGGGGERIPAWTRRAVQDPDTLIFSAQIWDPSEPYVWKHDYKRPPVAPLIYEAHVGMATEECRIGTFDEFRRNVLPRIVRAGYNTLQLMAIQEHPYYGSFGYHVSSFFAVSSRFGTPEELKALIDESHGYGMSVIMDLVHSHAVKNEIEGLGRYDGTPYQFFHDGPRREHIAWDSLCFNYGKPEVIHFLLSNCAFWLGEYHFDGFRFDGVTSMIYLDHGLGQNFTSYDMYYNENQDEDAIAYLALANKLIHEMRPDAITIAEDMSGMPGLAVSLKDGGYGFDYRLAMGTPDYWIKIIKEKPDEQWNVSEMYYELTNRRKDEKNIGYVESHDQALVGDKTIAFRLMDKDMYENMSKRKQSLVVDRGMALHKMIRLVTIATAGAGYLNFMGNEFGHPEWIDFPREGNNWSYLYARRQWSLCDRDDLRYHWLADFDRDMLALVKEASLFDEPFPALMTAVEHDQVLAFQRRNYLFVFNFNPVTSFTDYGVRVHPGKYAVVLDTDDARYGGFARVDHNLTYFAEPLARLASMGENQLKLYLPSRTGLVFKRISTPRVW
jgi:1,4-alpha-glucan branching enzyme